MESQKNMTLVKDVNGENCTLLLMKLLTGNGISDTTFVPEAMEKRKGIERVFMDGAADVESLYKLAYESGIDL